MSDRAEKLEQASKRSRAGPARRRWSVWAQIDQLAADHRQELARVAKAFRKWDLEAPRVDEYGLWWCDDLSISARSGRELLERVEALHRLPGMDLSTSSDG